MLFSKLSKALIIGALSSFTTAKHCDNVFRSIDSVKVYEGEGHPMDFYQIKLKWRFDQSQEVAVGDTFSLEMPYVMQVRLTEAKGFGNSFDIVTDDQTHISSCDLIQGAGRSSTSKIHCEVVADISSKSYLEGTSDFDIVFDAGGRFDKTDIAKHWSVGENEITFNDNISTIIDFKKADTYNTGIFARYTMQDDVYYYYLSPENVCQGSGIASGTFTFKTNVEWSDFGKLEQDATEVFVANEISEFGYPSKVEELPIVSSSYSSDGKTYTVKFGAIPAGSRFVFSSFAKYKYLNSQYQTFNALNCLCGDYSISNDVKRTNFRIVPGGTGSNGNGEAISTESTFTTTTTQTWTGSETTTSFTTGGNTVTEIVEVPSSQDQTTSFSETETQSTETTTVTKPWTGTFTSTFTKSYGPSESVVTVVVETPEASTEYTTTTEQWTESYATTTTEPFSSGATLITVVVETPEETPYASTEYTTTTESWSESYTTTTTEPFSSGATLITVVVETPEASTEYTTTTEQWSESYATTTTEPFSSGATLITVVVETPALSSESSGYWNSSTSIIQVGQTSSSGELTSISSQAPSSSIPESTISFTTIVVTTIISGHTVTATETVPCSQTDVSSSTSSIVASDASSSPVVSDSSIVVSTESSQESSLIYSTPAPSSSGSISHPVSGFTTIVYTTTISGSAVTLTETVPCSATGAPSSSATPTNEHSSNSPLTTSSDSSLIEKVHSEESSRAHEFSSATSVTTSGTSSFSTKETTGQSTKATATEASPSSAAKTASDAVPFESKSTASTESISESNVPSFTTHGYIHTTVIKASGSIESDITSTVTDVTIVTYNPTSSDGSNPRPVTSSVEGGSHSGNSSATAPAISTVPDGSAYEGAATKLSFATSGLIIFISMLLL